MGVQEYGLVGSEGASATGDALFPHSILTRKLCITGLCASASIAIVCVGVGAGYFSSAQSATQGWLSLHMARALKEIIPLFLNIMVAVLTESTGFIHATSLRWALGNKLNFTSNLRLFTSIQERLAFGWVSNFFNAGFLVLSYSATSLIFVGLPHPQVCTAQQLNNEVPCDDGSDQMYFCPGALIALGIGLAGNAALTTWQLTTVEIPTWSSSPIDIVWASSSIGQRRRVKGRCMVSVHEEKGITAPRIPKTPQQSAWPAHKEIRTVLVYLWVLVIAVLVWFGGLAGGISHGAKICKANPVSICTVFSGSSWSLLPDIGGVTSLAQIDTVLNNDHVTRNAGFALSFVLILAFQTMLTMGLHCAELLVNCARDEDTWREASTQKGYISRNALITVARSWKSIVLLILKPIVHWIFGQGMAFYYGWGIFMRPPQILYLAVVIIILAMFGTIICLRKPKGPQPAAFGHVQTLVNLIDDWNEHLFWGHKGRNTDGICHAGTGSSKLSKILMTEEYAAA